MLNTLTGSLHSLLLISEKKASNFQVLPPYRQSQLAYFHAALPPIRRRKKPPLPKYWKQAFQQLTAYLLSLAETEHFLKARKLKLSRYEIITLTMAFAKKERDGLYRLTDEYSIFYLRWIEGSQLTNKNAFNAIQKTPSWRAWSGYALESLAQRHITQVKEALGIAAVKTRHSSWIHRPNKTWPDGAQIDLVIDREDHSINLIEVKFSNEPFTITKAYANQLRKRTGTFCGVTKTPKNIFLTFLTVQGLNDNIHAREMADQIITADSLFSL